MSELAHHPVHPLPPARSDGATLKSYITAKHSLAAVVRQLQEFLARRGNQSRVDQCHDLMVKLAEDRFTLAVVGQFNRGKSSLMNAMLGHELLPVGILPLTSVITILRYGPRERLVIRREGFAFDSDAPLSSLAEYVTEQGNPGNEKNIRAVYVELPSPMLRRGLEFVDTPGIGSAIEANTRTTLSFIPQCDAVLFVTSADSPLAEAERNSLQTIRQHVRKIFFLVNKIDLLHGEDQQRMISFVTKTLSEQSLDPSVKVFPVSTRLALSNPSERTANFPLLSGMVFFKAELMEFLRTQKAETFLYAIFDKAKLLFAAESQSLDAEMRMASLPQNERERRIVEMQRQCEAMIRESNEKMMAEAAATKKIFVRMFESPLTDFLSKERDELNSDFQRADLCLCGAQRAGQIIDELARQLCEKLREDCQQWAPAQIDLLNGRFQEIVRHDRRRAKAGAQALGHTFAQTLDMDFSQAVVDEAFPDISLSIPPSPAINWKSPMPWVRQHLPILFSRRWIRRHLQTGIAEVVDEMRVVIFAGFRANLQQAFAELSRQTTSQLEKMRDEYLKQSAEPKGANSITGEPTTFESQAAERDRLRQRLYSLETEIAGVAEPISTTTEDFAEELSEISEDVSEEIAESFADSSLYYDIKTRGCPVCVHVRETLFRFYAQWQYALASDEHTQEQFAADIGFCPLHTWQLASVSSPDGMSLGFPKLAERIAADLQKQNIPVPSAHCAVCKLLGDTERAYAERLKAALQDKHFQQSYAESQGVCLRHLQLLTTAINSPPLRDFLLASAARHFTTLAEDMRSYAIKRDATRRQLANADENDAYQRTVIHLVGERYLCVALNPDAEI